MKLRQLILAVAAVAVGATSLLVTSAHAQAKEQYFPLLTFRTGPYAPSGAPWANGFVDYFKLVNLKGGINGVRIAWEECET
ncbi:MAG: ABC transporter substrate-binding protein, partial [Anaerolineae bacterium]|nr:ABC transporter substrate-binding protein [Anaerolineae bacterium]